MCDHELSRNYNAEDYANYVCFVVYSASRFRIFRVKL